MSNQETVIEMNDAGNGDLVAVTKTSKIKQRMPVIIVLITVLLALCGLITFIVVDINKEPKNVLEECSEVHEGYNLTSQTSLGVFTRFAVAADNKHCSTIGKDVLEKGGSAVDAAIAAGICNSIMNGHSMGIGGGHFMTIYIKSTNKSYVIDARDVAPLNSDRDMFVGTQGKSRIGGLYSAVPGEIYGYWKAHQLAGNLPWRDLFEPTIKLSEEGFPMSRAMATSARSRLSLIRLNKALSDLLIDPKTNTSYEEGDILVWKNYANTLRIISENGYEAVYNGVLTPIIVDEINQNGGNMTLEDFRRYEPYVYEDRLVVHLDENLRVYAPPPPSSGILVPTIMRIMKKFDLKNFNEMSSDDWNVFYHRLVETFKHVYSKRTNFGDENFVDMTKILEELVDQRYIDEIAAKINDKKTYPTSYYGPAIYRQESGTAHISVLAPNGDAVSLTSSINSFFGAKYAGEKTGLIYSDTMDDFSTPGLVNSYGYEPSEANFIVPGKRPLSSMSPIIVVDNSNQVRLVLGASGGSKIITGVAQVAIKSLLLGADMKTAIDERRIHHQLLPTNIELEEDFPISVAKQLRKIGHQTSCFAFGGSTVQGIRVLDKVFAYSDPRKGGVADGL